MYLSIHACAYTHAYIHYGLFCLSSFPVYICIHTYTHVYLFRAMVIRAEGEAEAAKLISEALKKGQGLLNLRRLEAARDIVSTISKVCLCVCVRVELCVYVYECWINLRLPGTSWQLSSRLFLCMRVGAGVCVYRLYTHPAYTYTHSVQPTIAFMSSHGSIPLPDTNRAHRHHTHARMHAYLSWHIQCLNAVQQRCFHPVGRR